MAWLILLLAAFFEIAWAIGLKYTEGFTRPLPTVLTIIAMVLSVVLLAHAVRSIPIGNAYAVWTGIGAIGTVIGGVVLFGDALTPARTICLLLILSGIVGLKLLD